MVFIQILAVMGGYASGIGLLIQAQITHLQWLSLLNPLFKKFSLLYLEKLWSITADCLGVLMLSGTGRF